MSTSTEVAVREAVVITPADRAAAAAAASDLDSWLIVMKDVVLLAEHICDTSFVPKAYRGNAPAVAAAILAGRELNLPPMTALRHVQVVEGSPGLSAEYKRARVLAAGHRLDITEHTTEACTVTGHRKGHEPVTVRFTINDARRAGLVKDRGAYTTRPRRMLFARACTEVCDALFADLTNGLPTTELLEEEVEYGEQREAVEQPQRQRITADAIRERRTVTAEVVTPQDASPADKTAPAAPQSPPKQQEAGPAGEAPAPPPALASSGQQKLLDKERQRLGYDETEEDWGQWLADLAGLVKIAAIASPAELTQPEAKDILWRLKPLADAKALRKLLDTGEIAGGGDGGE